jgi:hypothetical protein
MWCIAEITPEYRERMYRLLDLYEEDYNRKYPVICIDEKSKQLIEEARNPIPLRPGSPAKYRCNLNSKAKPVVRQYF